MDYILDEVAPFTGAQFDYALSLPHRFGTPGGKTMSLEDTLYDRSHTTPDPRACRSRYPPVTNSTHDRPDHEAAWVKIPGMDPSERNALRKMTLEELDKLEDRIDIAKDKIEKAKLAVRRQRVVDVPAIGTRVVFIALTGQSVTGTVIPASASVGKSSYHSLDPRRFHVLFDDGAFLSFQAPCMNVCLA